jgi:hypothetical protein
LKDGKKDYTKAFELASAMVENYWHLGNELERMKEAGLLHAGQPKKNPDKSTDTFMLSSSVYLKPFLNAHRN